MADVSRSVKQAAPKGDAEGQLDASLAPQGHHCLHDCRVPGSRKATIDHVVVGPSGVWVVRDVRVADAADIRDTDVRRALDHAGAVQKAIGCKPPQVVLAVVGAAVPGGADEREGVVIVAAKRTSDVIRNAQVVLRPEGVERLATKARQALEPKRSAPRGAVPDFIPDWVVDGKPSPTARRRRRLLRVALAVVVLAGLAALVPVGLDALSDDDPSAAAPASAMAVTFECRHAGAGWSQVIAWPGLRNVRSVSWSTAPEGPWVAMPAFGATAVRDGVAPSGRSFVRIVRATDDSEVVESMATATAPDQPC